MHFSLEFGYAEPIHPTLLKRARRTGEYIGGVCADEFDRSHNQHENHCQHHGILRDILAIIVPP